MKLAEALQERADLNRRIEQLRSRLSNNVLVQEGESPAEAPSALLQELEECLARLEWLMARINLTNSTVKVGGKTLTELIARRDVLSLRAEAYRCLVGEASQNTRRATRTEIKAAVAHAIEAVDLGGREKTMIANLSGGQKKRVSIAMELLASPRLLILDEPTSGLSPDLDRSMMELCRKLSHENCTVLMVTHNMSNINLCDKIAFLGTGGVLCYYGSPEAMDEYFDVELTSDIFEKLHDPEQVEYYRRKYFTSPEFNRLAARFPAAAKEAEKRCKA